MSTSYEASLPVLKGIALRVQRRCRAAGAASIQLEDIMQELAIAWIQADANYQPGPVPFVAYLRRGCFNHVNRWLKSEIGEFMLAPTSLDKTTGEDGENELHSAIPDTARPSDELLEEKELRDRALARLSPRARQFYEILESPPPELMSEVNNVQARAEFARSRGINTIAPTSLTAAQVFDLMGLTRAERNQVTAEIRAIGKVSQ
jgi:DNA-directed RNA polymerase specialized sigma24 family protein